MVTIPMTKMMMMTMPVSARTLAVEIDVWDQEVEAKPDEHGLVGNV